MSDILIIPPIEEKCEKCGKCVVVSVTSDPYDFDAPSLDSECKDIDCPINSRNTPNSDQKINICFVECSEDS